MSPDNGKWVLAFLLAAGLVNGVAYAFNLFDRLFWIDKALHFYTSFAVTLALAFVWRARLSSPLRRFPVTLALTVAALGLALGVVWEIGEWVADRFSGQNIIKGKTDTIIDLALDGAGAMLAGGWVALAGTDDAAATAGTRRRRHSPCRD